MDDRFEVTVSAGIMMADSGAAARFAHRWTPGGVTVEADFTGGHLLHLAAAGCVLNDLYREAATLGIELKGARVIAAGGFDTAAVIPALLTGVLASTHPGAPQDSGLVACAYPLSTQDVPATDYPKIRAEFAGSRWPDLRNAGTAYVDLAVALRTARGTDGYETVWFYQRLSAACAKHGHATPATGKTATRPW
jgi:hypothetical protein